MYNRGSHYLCISSLVTLIYRLLLLVKALLDSLTALALTASSSYHDFVLLLLCASNKLTYSCFS